MSVLRKAKEKARDGIRAVNAERRKQFQNIRPDKRRTNQASSSRATSYQYRQVNDAFEAALDDESEFFDKSLDESTSGSLAHGQQVSSISDRRTSDLFDYVEDPPIDENTPTLKDHASLDNLFPDDVQPISDPPLCLTGDSVSNHGPLSEIESNRDLLLENEQSCHDLLSEGEQSCHGLLSEGEHSNHDLLSESERSNHNLLSEGEQSNHGHLSEGEQSNHGLLSEGEQSNHGLLSEGEQSNHGLLSEGEQSNHGLLSEGLLSEGEQSNHGLLSGSEQSNHDLLSGNKDPLDFISELRTHSKLVDTDDIHGAQTSSDDSKPLSSDLRQSGNDDVMFSGDLSTNTASGDDTLIGNLEPHPDNHKSSAHSPLTVSSNNNSHLFEDKNDTTGADEEGHFLSNVVNERADHNVSDHSHETGLTLGETILIVEDFQEDDLFPDDTNVSKQYKSRDIHKESKVRSETLNKPDLSLSSSYSPTSSLASSYEEDHFINAHFPKTRAHSPGKAGSELGKKVKTEPSNVETYPIEECDTVLPLKPNNGQVVSQTPESLSGHPLEVPLQQPGHLDSGVFDQGSFKASNEDELFQIQEDYFKTSSHSAANTRNLPKPTLALGKPSVKSSPQQTTPPKRNSAGKVPPRRPQFSPGLRRKLYTTSLEPTIKTALEDKSQHEESSRPGQILTNKEDRLVADDLFEKDLEPKPSDSLPKHHIPVKLVDQATPSDDQATPSDGQAKPPSDPDQGGQAEIKTRFWRDESAVGHDPYLTVRYHLLLAFLLFLHYTINSYSYFAGVLTGVLVMFLLVGTLFIYYISTIETERREKRKKQSCFVKPSEEFLRKMDVNFDKVKLYQSTQFTATMSYDPATHHPSQRLKAKVKLVSDFFLQVIIYEVPNTSPQKVRLDTRHCKITMVPEEVAKNRKRRWNKKFPICITETSTKVNFFLFPPTSRDKEDWFRRLRHAAEGYTSEDLIEKLNGFFGYMEDYFPGTALKSPGKNRTVSGSSLLRPPKFKTTNRIQFSRESEEILSEEDSFSGIAISRESGPRVGRHSRRQSSPLRSPQLSTTSLESSVDLSLPRHASVSSMTSKESVTDREFEHLFRPLKVTADTLWLNTVAARLCWDIWHDHRWKDWVKSRIQKKLVRLKTPSFMEPLSLTDVELGNDMPVVNRLCGGPRLDLRGLWVYLDITYEGRFVMTIKTKLKSGKKDDEPGQQMSVLKSSGLPAASPHHKHTRSALSHTHAAKALSSLGTSVDPYDNEIDSGSDDEDGALLSHSVIDELHRQEDTTEKGEQLITSNRDRLKSVVMKIGKRVANTKIVRKAVEKVSSYPLVLTVVVNRLDGVLAVNIPPPTTDTIWFGFVESPRLQLVAKPKLGHREVKLSAVTQWIEKKLCEVVDKKLVLPEMEDIVIPVLNSGLPEDTQKVLVTDNDQT